MKLVLQTDPGVPAGTKGPIFMFETDTGRLWFDQDGSGTEHDIALIGTLNGVSTLATSDFVLIA